jgi:hypothetical protein
MLSDLTKTSHGQVRAIVRLMSLKQIRGIARCQIHRGYVEKACPEVTCDRHVPGLECLGTSMTTPLDDLLTVEYRPRCDMLRCIRPSSLGDLE